MFYINPFGKTVKLMNRKPINYSEGGLIRWEAGQYHPFKNDLQHDNKPVLLEVGSMVIPRPVIHLFHSFEEKYGSVKQRKVIDPNELVEICVMPEEAIVPKKHAEAMKNHLKAHGVTLPLPRHSYFQRNE